ncbi:vitelline membrane protein Vm26Ab-like [Stomoxys calcitrans]|uniref:VM domain-containing protein n=1 Tax=Stomoxys calcitrans TaxID=35570 RepID=A0A1I8PBS9_STOCA|nr:vitelline membrane protein Vm26Ab-like [Stomoxys calcitrans]
MKVLIAVIACLAVVMAAEENMARDERSSNPAPGPSAYNGQGAPNFGAREERSPSAGPGASAFNAPNAPTFGVREERSPIVGPAAAQFASPLYHIRPERSYGSAAAAAGPSYGAPAAAVPAYNAAANPVYSAPAPLTIPAPPCPKNYLFSCQPSLTPAPCSHVAYGGNTGSYSHNYPVYAQPQYINNFRPYQ